MRSGSDAMGDGGHVRVLLRFLRLRPFHRNGIATRNHAIAVGEGGLLSLLCWFFINWYVYNVKGMKYASRILQYKWVYQYK